MELNKYHPLKSLDTSSYDWICRVRLQSFWEGVKRDTKEFWGINMTFIDDSNWRIHAFASSKYCEGLAEKLNEGDIYVLSNFKVKHYVGDETYRPVRNQKHIYFTQHTKIEKDLNEGLTIENYAFDIFHFKEIEKLAEDNRYLIDMVGKLQNLRPKITTVKNNVEKTLLKFEMYDGRTTVNVTLFDDFGTKFEEEVKNCRDEEIYLVMSCAKVGRYEGKPILTNYPASRLYINPEHYSVKDLKLKLEAMVLAEVSSPEEEDHIKMLTVKEIKKLQADFKESKVNCQVTVKKIEEKAGWYYNKCTKCFQEVQIEGKIYKCSDCRRIIPYPEKRFRICTVCSDSTGSIAIIFLDSEVSRLLDKEVLDIDADCMEENKDDNFPEVLKQFQNKKYTITLKLKEENLHEQSTVYEACHIFDKVEAGGNYDPSRQGNMERQQTSSVNLTEPNIDTPPTGISSNKPRCRKNPEPIPYEFPEQSPSKEQTKIKKERA